MPSSPNNGQAERNFKMLTGDPPKSLSVPMGTLHILAIGVGEYKEASRRLTFPAKDAADLVVVLEEQGRRLYQKVIAKKLCDSEATRTNVLSAVEQLQKSATAADVVILFLAGHGVNDDASDLYYYLPVEFQFATSSLAADAVPGAQLATLLEKTRGRRIVILDTCNAGNVLPSGRLGEMRGSSRTEPPTLLRMLAQAQSSVWMKRGGEQDFLTVLASCRADQSALESPEWQNGAFTKALIEGLLGGADNGTGLVTLDTLKSYVNLRVKALTNGAQQPTAAVLTGATEIVLATQPFEHSIQDAQINVAVGDYVIRRKLRENERIVVYEATSDSDGASPTIAQILTPRIEIPSSDPMQTNFARAAKTYKALAGVDEGDHRTAGFIQALSFGRLDHRRYILLEQTTGKTLSDLILSKAPIAPSTIEICATVAAALSAAHAIKVLYLGLQPDGIVLEGGSTRLQFVESVQRFDEPCALVLGGDSTPVHDECDPIYFVAPEVYGSSAPASETADVYSLGVLAYRLISGHYPFSGQRYRDIMEAKRGASPSLLTADGTRSNQPDIPVELLVLVQRMVSLDPAQRPSMSEAAQLFSEKRTHTALPEHPQLLALPAVPMSIPVPPAQVSEPEQLPTTQPVAGQPVLVQPVPPQPPLALLAPLADATIKVGPHLTVAPMLEAPAGEPPIAPGSPRWLPLGAGAAVIAVVTVFGIGSLRQPTRHSQSPDASTRHDSGIVAPVSSPPTPQEHPSPKAKEPAPLQDIVCLAGGTVTTKDHGPARASAFCLDRVEVSNEQFAHWLQAKTGLVYSAETLSDGKKPLIFLGKPYSGIQYENGAVAVRPAAAKKPVVQVSWEGARQYCTEQKKRLPSETEWLVAAHYGDTAYPFPWGPKAPSCEGVTLDRQTNGRCQAHGVGPQEVGQSAEDRTPEGIFDLAGNVSEWVVSRSGVNAAARYLALGGTWALETAKWRARFPVPDGRFGSDRGFRCATDAVDRNQP